VQFDQLGVFRHDLLEKFPGLGSHPGIIHQHLVHLVTEIIADGADDQVGFLVDQGRCLAGLALLPDLFVQPQQIIDIPFQIGLLLHAAGGPDDIAHVVRQLQTLHDLLELFSIAFLFDLAGDALGIRFRHQHHVAPGQGQVGGQGRALGAALFLDHLHQNFLAAAQQIGDARPLARLGPAFGVAEKGWMDFADLQKAQPFTAEIDKGRLQSRFHPGDNGLVNVAFGLFLAGDFNVEFGQVAVLDNGHPVLFGMGGVDQHLFGHKNPSDHRGGGLNRCDGP
jgi:hypothetical protein